jgi:hypothetical protein
MRRQTSSATSGAGLEVDDVVAGDGDVGELALLLARRLEPVDRPVGHSADGQVVVEVVDRQAHELALRR